MPTYKVTLSDGRVVTVEADKPPTESDVLTALGGATAATRTPPGGAGGAPWSSEEFAPRSEPPQLTPSLHDFLSNVVHSAGKFVEGVTAPVVHPKDFVNGLAKLATPQGRSDAGNLLWNQLKDRYGSVDAILKTAYTDPIGFASDVSMLAGGAGAIAKAAGAADAATQLGRVSAILNPLTVPAKTGEWLGQTAYTAAINPSRYIRQAYPGAMKAGYEANILPTHGGSERVDPMLGQSSAQLQGRLTEAEAAGAPNVTADQITPAIDKPLARAALRENLGRGTGEVDELLDKQAAIEWALNKQGGLPLTTANKVKQEAQNLAENAFNAQRKGQIIKDLDALSDQRVATAYKNAIANNAAAVGVTDINDINTRTQSLIGLGKALEQATNQPTRLTHLAAAMEGIGQAMAGGLPAGAVGYTATRLATAKPVMAAAGLIVGKSATALRQAQIMRALSFLNDVSQKGQSNEEQQ